MINNIEFFDGLLKDLNITKDEAYEILKKHNIHDEDEEREEREGRIVNQSMFINQIMNGRTELHEDEIDYIEFTGFILEPKFDFALDAYYSKYNYLPVSMIAVENRQYVFDYLTRKRMHVNKTFGLTQEHDLERLHNGYDIDSNLDFANWDAMQIDIFDDERYRTKLINHFVNLFSKNYLYDQTYHIFREVLIEKGGMEILDYLMTDHEFDLIVNEIFRSDKTNNGIMMALSAYDIQRDEVVYNLIKNLVYGSNYSWHCSNINIRSYVRYVKNANFTIRNAENKDDVPYYYQNVNEAVEIYRRNSSTQFDEILSYEYSTCIDFTGKPLMFNVTDIFDRYKYCGIFTPEDLPLAEISPPQYSDFVEFMLNNVTEKDIDALMLEDNWFELDVFRNNRLKRHQTVDILNKFPELLVYYAV